MDSCFAHVSTSSLGISDSGHKRGDFFYFLINFSRRKKLTLDFAKRQRDKIIKRDKLIKEFRFQENNQGDIIKDKG